MSSSNGEMVFDISPIHVPVQVGDKNYILIDASEDVALKYRNTAVSRTKLQDGKIVGYGDLADMEVILVAGCLCETESDGTIRLSSDKTPVRVPIQKVRGWPSRVVKPIYEKAKEISDLLERKEEDPDPELIARCRKDLAEQHHPDRGGEDGVMTGVNLACDWLKEHRREVEETTKKS